MKARRRTLASAIRIAVLLALPVGAVAQEATTLDTLTVTGSRIKRAEMEGRVPVQTLSREEIERTGLTSIGDILQELTGSGSALNTKFNSSGNFGFSPNGDGVGAGSAQVDLRNLGPKRVLVLVDGMRWVNESSASGVSAAVDLNTIPLALVERIEVLEDGASSLYGSDAIAGVVNIITRRNFDGGQVTLNYGQFDKGDGEVTGADVAWGFDNERSNLFLIPLDDERQWYRYHHLFNEVLLGVTNSEDFHDFFWIPWAISYRLTSFNVLAIFNFWTTS